MTPKLCPHCRGPIIEAIFVLHEVPFPDPYCGRCGRNYPREAKPIKAPEPIEAE